MPNQEPESLSSQPVDHVVIAVTDLDAAAARFADEHGLASVSGGRHPGWGTANRIIPLGGPYLELAAVVDPIEAAGTAFGRAVLAGATDTGRLVGWAVTVPDLEPVASGLGLAVLDGSRTRPDGSVLRWRLAGVDTALATGAVPFLIEWSVPPEARPGVAVAPHRCRPTGSLTVELDPAGGLVARVGTEDGEITVT